VAMFAFRPGDIVAIRGARLLSRLIEDFSGPISHVGMVTSIDTQIVNRIPCQRPMVTQALMPKVATLSLEETVAKAQYAYALQSAQIPLDDLQAIADYVKSREGVSYDRRDLAWQACDRIFHTEWFTIHLASDELDICSELVAFGYGIKGYTFNVPRRVATPTEIFDYALGRQDWIVTRL